MHSFLGCRINLRETSSMDWRSPMQNETSMTPERQLRQPIPLVEHAWALGNRRAGAPPHSSCWRDAYASPWQSAQTFAPVIVGLNVAPKGALPFSRGKRVVHRKRVVHHHKFHIYLPKT